ncbi:MAG: hypothetical protein WAQ53_13605 [Thiofilum sp.]|uniref:hypothetical protein n=1 Tax=Thiofilum sp. TaxID=2212733 RepID=UPI0025D4884C|nr:hypothetical protein [Thiofilum sp.]MBK8453607.1 hypothetical protein [Thiofilum sp.]
MEDLLFIVFLVAVGALVWLKINQGNTDKLNALKRKAKGATGIKIVEIALLLCAGAMGSFFAYQLLSPISALLAIVAAVLVIFFNLSEGYILRSTVNSFRHNNILVGGIGIITVLMLMLYSLTAGSSVIETFLNKHDDIKKYYQYEELASKQRIEGAQAQVLAAQLKARESDKYGYLNSESVATAQANASTLSANEYSRMAQLMKDKAPDLKIAFGFDHESIAFIMALVLELSIIGVVIYQVLYVQNDALLSAVRYENKTLNWNVNPHHTANLSLENSPAPDIIALPYSAPQVGFGGVVPTLNPVQANPAYPVSNPVQLDPVQAPSNPVHRVTQGSTRAVPTQGSHDPALSDANLAPTDKQDELFDLWVMKLRAGELKPSTEQTRLFISEHKLANGIKLIAALADSWLSRAYNIGILELNPIQKNGVSKYKLANNQQSGVIHLDKVA